MDGDAERIRRRLSDLAGFANEAAYLVSMGRDAYLAATMDGRILRNAGERILIKVATVVEKLPQSLKDSWPDVQWVSIGRMRNLVAHHYDKVVDEFVWEALKVWIPDLAEHLGAQSRSSWVRCRLQPQAPGEV